ncbi:MAG TPA: YfiR family protein [Aliidongia sp.]|uniref:YfiR family protein n=1 Tax=Aliidongia sp. TaxID=1914230 RepID=UPI002DDD29E8|nr:YfiR family protein [Aliidongia sp.]HEV2673767.1 YfiR family protein [Aliidongia sp.]
MTGPRPASGRFKRWGFIAAALLCLGLSDARADDGPGVAAIEAAYLTKFAAFVDWPAGEPAGPRTLCVFDHDQIAGLIEIAESKPAADASPTALRRLAPGAPTAGCQILFIDADGKANTPPPEAAVPGASTLVVTNQAEEGHKGVINFVVRDNHVRFEIDDAQAARRGLTISSKLLSLAVAVRPREP